MKSIEMTSYAAEKVIFFLTIFTGFLGNALFLVDLGPFHLFPYRIFSVILWFIFLAHMLVQKEGFSIPISKVKRYIWFFGLWIVYSVLSIGWAIDNSAALKDVVFVFLGCSIVFFTVYYCKNQQDLSLLHSLWFGVFILLLLTGFWENVTGNHLPVSRYYNETRPGHMYRPTGVWYNPNDYATFLALSFPFGLALLRYSSKFSVKLLSLGAILSAYYLTFETESRANMLALLMITVFFVLLLNRKKKFSIIVGVIGASFLLLFLFPGTLQPLRDELVSELDEILYQLQTETGSIGIRVNLVRNGLSFFRSTTGLGVGAGNAEYWMSHHAPCSTFGILNPHNWWLENFINYGIFISFGYFIVYLNLLWNLWKRWLSASTLKDKMISETLLLALVGFSFASLSSSSLLAFKPQWLLIAFALAFINYFRKIEYD